MCAVQVCRDVPLGIAGFAICDTKVQCSVCVQLFSFVLVRLTRMQNFSDDLFLFFASFRVFRGR